jgi:hypothetical protein
MTLPTHYTGKDGEVKVDGVPTTLVNFNIDIGVGTIASPRIGKTSDVMYPGKKSFTGTITQVLVTGDLLAKVIGSDSDITTSSTAACLAETDMSDNTRTEITVTDTSANPTSVRLTLTSCDTSNNDAGSIVVQGTDSNGNTVAEVFAFDAMTAGDPNQIKYGSQIFASVDYVDVSANLRQGQGDTAWNTLKIDWVGGTKTITPGTTQMFDLIGKVVDANGKYFQLTCTNCFFTGGSFPIGDSETLVQTDLPFVVQDADEDVELVWSSV